MKKIRKTYLGKTVDIEGVLQKNAMKPRIGNVNRNVRGDEIDHKGNVIKTAEEIQKDHERILKNRVVEPDVNLATEDTDFVTLDDLSKQLNKNTRTRTTKAKSNGSKKSASSE